MTLNFGSLVWTLSVEQDKRSAAMPNVLRAGMVTVLLIFNALLGTLRAQGSPDWTEPFPPFRIAGNLYYVGSKGLANYLITTPQGHILVNSDLEASVPLIRASVEKLGYKFSDIRILLISHAHWDHDAGSAAIKTLTGAKYMVMDADVPVVESGGKADFQYGNQPASLYPPAKVDRVLHDGDEVKLGDATLVARLTPGHTKGCTTWTMRVTEAGKTYDVVIVGSPNVNPGYRLVGNPSYPEIASDYERTFQGPQIPAGRHFPRRSRGLLRSPLEIRATEGRSRNTFCRSSGLQELRSQQGERFPRGAGKAEGRPPGW